MNESEPDQESYLKDKKAYLFDIGELSCYVTYDTKQGSGSAEEGGEPAEIYLGCDVDGVLSHKVDLTKLRDIQAWIHLTFSANYDSENPSSYL